MNESSKTIWVKCPTCSFELTLGMQEELQDKLFKMIKGSTVPCWVCGGKAELVREGGQA